MCMNGWLIEKQSCFCLFTNHFPIAASPTADQSCRGGFHHFIAENKILRPFSVEKKSFLFLSTIEYYGDCKIMLLPLFGGEMKWLA